MMVTTRPATGDDKEFLWDLKVKTMRRYVEQLYGWDAAYQYEHFENSFRLQMMRIIQYDGQDAGMVELLERPEELFLSRIEVLPEFQNKGIGTTIIQGAIDQAAAGQKPLRLQVFKINPARGLYERLGFVATGETNTHIKMAWLNKDGD